MACSRFRSRRSIFWDSVRDAAGLDDVPFSERDSLVEVTSCGLGLSARPASVAVRLAGATGAAADVVVVVVVDAGGGSGAAAGAIGALVLVTGSGNVKSSK